MDAVTLVLCLLIGLLAGLMSGLFGIGGGSVRIPLLNLAGLPLVVAFGVNLFVIPFSSSIGAYTHKGNVDRRVAVYVIVGGALGSVAGALLVGLFPALALAVLFVVTASVTVLGIYLDRLAPSLHERLRPTSGNLVGIPLVLNLVTGMRGGSGGSLFPPFLRAVGLDIHRAIATSLFVTVFTALLAIAVYWQRGDIDWLPALFVLAGSVAGSWAGSEASLKTRPRWLEAGLSVLVIVLALLTVVRAL